MGALFGLVRIRVGAGPFGIRLLLRDVALGVGLAPLGLTLVTQVFVAGDGADRFLGLALHTFHDALSAGFGTGVLLWHLAVPLVGVLLASRYPVRHTTILSACVADARRDRSASRDKPVPLASGVALCFRHGCQRRTRCRRPQCSVM